MTRYLPVQLCLVPHHVKHRFNLDTWTHADSIARNGSTHDAPWLPGLAPSSVFIRKFGIIDAKDQSKLRSEIPIKLFQELLMEQIEIDGNDPATWERLALEFMSRARGRI